LLIPATSVESLSIATSLLPAPRASRISVVDGAAEIMRSIFEGSVILFPARSVVGIDEAEVAEAEAAFMPAEHEVSESTSIAAESNAIIFVRIFMYYFPLKVIL
jgi:hypothetical protein